MISNYASLMDIIFFFLILIKIGMTKQSYHKQNVSKVTVAVTQNFQNNFRNNLIQVVQYKKTVI